MNRPTGEIQMNSALKTRLRKIVWSVLWCKKSRYQQAFWNFLNPHVSHQHPTLTKYFASNCAAEVFLSLLLWSYDVRGCFHWLCADSSSSRRSVQKKTPVKPRRTRSEPWHQERFLMFVLQILLNQDGPQCSDQEVTGLNPRENPRRERENEKHVISSSAELQ